MPLAKTIQGLILLVFVLTVSAVNAQVKEKVNIKHANPVKPNTISANPEGNSYELVDVAKKHYSLEEINSMSLADKKSVNYLYTSSYTLKNNSSDKSCKEKEKNFDVADFNMKRKKSERVTVLADKECELYVELFSWDEVRSVKFD